MKNKNILNMEKCPHYEGCSVPKCPLDIDMDLRVELPEDEMCSNLRYLGVRKNARMKKTLTPSLKPLLEEITLKRFEKYPKRYKVSSQGR